MKTPVLDVDTQGSLLSPTSYWEAGEVIIRSLPRAISMQGDRGFRSISSCIYGGGLQTTQYIGNFQVERSYRSMEPEKDLQDRFKEVGVPEEKMPLAAGFLTAASVLDAGWEVRTGEQWELLTCVSVGTANSVRIPMAASDDLNRSYSPGTINIITLIAGVVRPEALVGGVITATEAKTAALYDLNIRVSDGRHATGTSTDAILLGSTQRALVRHRSLDDEKPMNEIQYAGLATTFGQALGSAVYNAVLHAGTRYLRR
ncbi:adenosylcobinamide amidohydrolase [Alicyclobacillus sp. SO9]|uniref:adenosylcobinamide amidohydrolase n=1 Tax=Alicyclobacillus sp. SO9 TaxID=2665646 RepID=UPI0018E89A83|nr:adenosylcobinamide amidohydrolase [Alicyclobacillus sp. SO9]QQE79683.1 adenosylcobinamide amidohydrolase [Alicyclobacillus sp. SO9]